jgi:hypothetical protein
MIIIKKIFLSLKNKKLKLNVIYDIKFLYYVSTCLLKIIYQIKNQRYHITYVIFVSKKKMFEIFFFILNYFFLEIF